MTTTMDANKTLVDALKNAFEMAVRSPEGVAEPAAILWTDTDREWQSLIPALLSAFPQLYILGDYDSVNRTGPVIWLKCVVDRTLPKVSPATDVIPILYLPGINRQLLRASADCPSHLQPLVELQYRGTVWHQRNGRDWTVEAFLSSEAGLGLDISQDARTKEAMLRALPLLAGEPVASLRGKRLEAEDFDRLSFGDPVRDLLGWLSSPETFQGRCDSAKWKTFREVGKREFDFDPEEGASVAGDALLHGGGRWDDAWRRFCDAPQLYRGISNLLRNAKARDLYIDESKMPAKNEECEEQLKRVFAEILALPQPQACERILQLDLEHQKRRQWVWARLGESPLCMLLEPLAKLATLVKSPLGGLSVKQIVADYVANGWYCDRAVLDALVRIKSFADSDLIKDVIRVLYEPWLDQTTRHFQKLIEKNSEEINSLIKSISGEKETCVLFVDGLRYDLGAMLLEKLESKNLKACLDHRISPFPTVTATAKPVAAALQSSCEGDVGGGDFYPVLKGTKQPLTTVRFREALQKNKIALLESSENSYARGNEMGAWTEIGEMDELGHKLGTRLVQHLEMELDLIVERVISLLDGGWPRVRITTDHGWLLMPGGLRKVELPHFLVSTKWSRCAVVRGEASPDVPILPWFWNPDVRIASPPGAGAFILGNEYAHGGVSLQECVIPEIIIERGEVVARPKITGIRWVRLLCRVAVNGNIKGVKVDLRLNWKQPNTSIAANIKELIGNNATLAVADDKYDGAAVSVVILDEAGRVLDHQPTTIGVNL